MFFTKLRPDREILYSGGSGCQDLHRPDFLPGFHGNDGHAGRSDAQALFHAALSHYCGMTMETDKHNDKAEASQGIYVFAKGLSEETRS